MFLTTVFTPTVLANATKTTVKTTNSFVTLVSFSLCTANSFNTDSFSVRYRKMHGSEEDIIAVVPVFCHLTHNTVCEFKCHYWHIVFHPVSPPRCLTFTRKCDGLTSPSSATSLPFTPHPLSPQSPGHAASTKGSPPVPSPVPGAPSRVTAASTGGVWAQPSGST